MRSPSPAGAKELSATAKGPRYRASASLGHRASPATPDTGPGNALALGAPNRYGAPGLVGPTTERAVVRLPQSERRRRWGSGGPSDDDGGAPRASVAHGGVQRATQRCRLVTSLDDNRHQLKTHRGAGSPPSSLPAFNGDVITVSFASGGQHVLLSSFVVVVRPRPQVVPHVSPKTSTSSHGAGTVVQWSRNKDDCRPSSQTPRLKSSVALCLRPCWGSSALLCSGTARPATTTAALQLRRSRQQRFPLAWLRPRQAQAQLQDRRL
jgi:hypothetical protein